MEKRIWLRVDKKHKTALESIAKSQGMTLVDYMRYKLIDQNPDLVQNQHLKDENYVENRIRNADKKIESRHAKNLEQRGKLQHRADKSYKKNVWIKASKNAAKSVNPFGTFDKKKTLEPTGDK